MTATTWLAIACGIGVGLGLWSIASRLPRLARPRLATRLAPYLLDVSAEARRLTARPVADPVPVLGVVAIPLLDGFQSLVGNVLGGQGRARLLLARAGGQRTLEGYRLRQLLGTAAGALAGAALGAVAASRGEPAALLAAPIVGAGCGLVACDRLLARRAAARVARIESELPTVLEFLALSLAAGEGVHDALRRVGTVGSGELAAIVQRVVAEVAVGVPLSGALTTVGDELRIPSLTRCLSHVVGALERGSPLAEVLRTQAADSREAARRDLLEAAGKKEIAMLVPLVFLILPVTLAFAVFPGILVLETRL